MCIVSHVTLCTDELLYHLSALRVRFFVGNWLVDAVLLTLLPMTMI